MFTLPGAEQLPILSLTRCSVLRGAEFDNVASLVDGLLAESVPAGVWPDPEEVRSEYSGAADYWGWAGTWPKVPLARILPPETKAKMQTFETELLSAFPELGNAQDFRFWGRVTSPGFPLRISFKAPGSEEAVLLAKGLPEWLKQHGGKVGIVSASASFDAKTERITMELHIVPVEN